MIILIAFAFLAGIVTVLSPCILPILPIVLSSTIGGEQTGKGRPLGVVVGFLLSFTFFTLFLSAIVNASGIPADSLRLFSVIVIAAFGISFLIPKFQELLERLFSSLARFAPQANTKRGFWSGVLIGLSIGLLWTPCVGPILASVISLAISGSVNFSAFIITFAYAFGTAIPMFAIMIGGQNLLRKVPWLLANTGNIQKVFGVVMILTALAIFNNYDRRFQTFILNKFPQYGAGLTKFEENTSVKNQLDKLNNKPAVDDKNIGKPAFDSQPKGQTAPEIIPGGEWLNSKPLTLAELRGKVVVIDFWTYSCINCQRTLPYLKDWYAKYKDKGLVIIGVHSPEFAFEKDRDNLAQALKDFNITYPVVQDNDFATWRAYQNNYWPAKYIIDKDGYIRFTHFGEGQYDETEKIIQELLKETGRKDVSMPIKNDEYKLYASTPETYLGSGRMERFASPEEVVVDKITKFSAPSNLPLHYVAFKGDWIVHEENANPQKGSSLLLNFGAKDVYLVMRPAGSTPGKVKIYEDGKQVESGRDIKSGVMTIDEDRLYNILNLQSAGNHLLRIDFQDSNIEVFAFTFG